MDAFSGATRGLMAGHVAPEAAHAGPIAAVREGDMVVVDIPARQLRMEVRADDAEIARRLSEWRAPAPALVRVGCLCKVCGNGDVGVARRDDGSCQLILLCSVLRETEAVSLVALASLDQPLLMSEGRSS